MRYPKTQRFLTEYRADPRREHLNYLTVNQKAYDALADQYEQRIASDTRGDTMLMAPFFRLLSRQFASQLGLKILDVGCGNGLNLKMIAENGHHATGIDLSQRMIELARRTAPAAELLMGNFLDTPFAPSCYHGVFAKSVIHLFPKRHVPEFLSRVKSILQPNGVFYVTTTTESSSSEGFSPKLDYIGRPTRYRSRWTEDELAKTLEDHGFCIVSHDNDYEVARNKTWINYWATKND